jgi:hypothetical protein
VGLIQAIYPQIRVFLKPKLILAAENLALWQQLAVLVHRQLEQTQNGIYSYSKAGRIEMDPNDRFYGKYPK